MSKELSSGEKRPQAAVVCIAATLPTILQRLWVFAFRLSGIEDEAEALVQRACVRALDQVDCWNPDIPVLVGAFGLMVDIWTNELSASSKRADISVPIRNMLPNDIRSRARDAITNDSNRWVVKAVGQMSDPQRIAVLLLYAD